MTLPELPTPAFTYERRPAVFAEPVRVGAYTADQMHDYVRQYGELCASQERERCAKICEPKWPRPCSCVFCDCGDSECAADVEYWDQATSFAAAIRKGEE